MESKSSSVLLFGLLLALAGCRSACMRDDDSLEANDWLDEATPMRLGEPIEARANEGDPDAFVVEVPAGRTLVWEATHRGKENNAGFDLYGPGFARIEWERADAGAFAGATFEGVTNPDKHWQYATYRFRVTPTREGRYYMIITEHGQADNMLPFSWDYRLTATLE